MSNDEGMTKSEAWKRVRGDFLGFVNSAFLRHSSFVIRHSSFALRHLASTHRCQASRDAAPARSHQKLAPLHHLLAIKPDVEIAANAVDMCFGKPLGAGVLGVRMAEGDVHSWDLFVLQNVADDVRAGGVGANREFADTIAVLVSARVSAKFVAQIFVL